MEPWFSILPSELVQGGFDRIWTGSWTRGSKPRFSILPTESVQPDEPNRVVKSPKVDGTLIFHFLDFLAAHIRFHTSKEVSSRAVRLGENIKIGPERTIGKVHNAWFVASNWRSILIHQTSGMLKRIHGSLMVAAWLIAASVGMMFPRYMKKTWTGKQWLGKDRWFIVGQITIYLIL